MTATTSDPVSSDTAKLSLGDQEIELPIVVGTEGERSVDISRLRADTGHITLDPGYRNTGSCTSDITFINGEKGVLRYRGYPIEQVAEKLSFVQAAWLVIHGEVPTESERDHFRRLLTDHAPIHEGMRQAFDGFPATAHPMAILSAMINTLYCYQPEVMDPTDGEAFVDASARLLSKIRTIAAASYKVSRGQPIMYPRYDLKYCENFMHMMFSQPNKYIEPDPDIDRALNLILILHADHEQNCSTATVRMVGSSGANMFASCAAGVCALWGPLHGGANVAVLNQLNEIHKSGMSPAEYVEHIKTTKGKLYGFGHAVYKNFDPRAKILKIAADKVLAKSGRDDPLLDIARALEEAALSDDYFVERNLYPNVDFYSGIIMRAIGIPTNMFTVMFAIGRMPGWIANYKEVHETGSRIYRPRQVYTGPGVRELPDTPDY